jgi:tellurite resistance protein TerA
MSVDLGKRSGTINLDKGQRVTIEKTAKTTAMVSFSSATDYDVYAVILMADGSEKVCSTFGSEAQRQPTPQVLGVRHLGDIQRGGGSDINTETLEINLSDSIDQIAVVAYSAQSNGTGSFRKYKVSMIVDNGAGTTVSIDAKNANSNDNIYTCVPAIIRNASDGVVIEQVEMYSKPNSENRPSFLGVPASKKSSFFGMKTTVVAGIPTGTLRMDAGSKNLYK